MNSIVWIILGALLGIGAGRITKSSRRDLFINVGIGILGALLGGEVLSPLFGLGTFHRDDFNIPALFVSFMGAVMMLVIVNLARQETKLDPLLQRRTRDRYSTDPSRHSKA